MALLWMILLWRNRFKLFRYPELVSGSQIKCIKSNYVILKQVQNNVTLL